MTHKYKIESNLTPVEAEFIGQLRATVHIPSTTLADMVPVVLATERAMRAAGQRFRAPLVLAVLYPDTAWLRTQTVLGAALGSAPGEVITP